MFIITHKPELSIWITETPFQKKSGTWHFYDNEEEYFIDLNNFKAKYGSKFLFTLKKIKEMYKDRDRNDNDDAE